MDSPDNAPKYRVIDKLDLSPTEKAYAIAVSRELCADVTLLHSPNLRMEIIAGAFADTLRRMHELLLAPDLPIPENPEEIKANRFKIIEAMGLDEDERYTAKGLADRLHARIAGHLDTLPPGARFEAVAAACAETLSYINHVVEHFPTPAPSAFEALMAKARASGVSPEALEFIRRAKSQGMSRARIKDVLWRKFGLVDQA